MQAVRHSNAFSSGFQFEICQSWRDILNETHFSFPKSFGSSTGLHLLNDAITSESLE